MALGTYRHILVERKGKVLNAMLNRPDLRNAINAELDLDIMHLMYDFDRDPESHVLVLTGAGKSFCAGGDLEHMKKTVADMDVFLSGMTNGKRILNMMLECEKPIISKVNGDAIGLGATIALFSDFVIASEGARFGDPHVRVGLVAGDGGAIIWPELIGYARAKRYLLMGDLIEAREAEAIGLIAHCVPPSDLDQATDALASRLVNGATRAIRFTKAVTNIGLRQRLASMLDAGFALEGLTSRSNDHREAVTAFVEKRKPVFSGS